MSTLKWLRVRALRASIASVALCGSACGGHDDRTQPTAGADASGGQGSIDGGAAGAEGLGGSGGSAKGGAGGDASVYSNDGGSGGDAAPTGLRVEPQTATLDVVGKTAQSLQLNALALPGEQPAAAQWSIDNPLLGTIDENGVFRSSNQAGGVVHVTATYEGFSATATLTLRYSTALSSGSVPAEASSLFDASNKSVVTEGPDVPALVYPVDGTMFPQNVYRVLFQWHGRSKPLFQLEFTSPVLRVSTYTDGVHATCQQAQTGGACWESSVESWTALAASNAGQTLTLKIRALDSASAPTTIYESPAYTLHFSQKDVPGAIYYWSTTVAGVRRGAMGDAGPTNFLTPGEADNKCVACHTLSKNGKLLAADVGGEKLGVFQVTPEVPPPMNFGPIGAAPTSYASSWATFDPSARYVVQSKSGVMTLRDAVSGTTVGPNGGVIGLGTSQFAVQPDWAGDGKHLVFASNDGTKNTTKDRAGGTVLRWINTTITSDSVQYGAVETLQPAQSDVRYGYPMFNPTSEHLAYVRGRAIEKDLTDEIWVMPAAVGGSAARSLTRANQLVSNGQIPVAGVENNMPSWAPSTGPDVQWVAFASKRDYGFVLCSSTGSTPAVCNTTSEIGAGKQQIWIAAVDLNKLGTQEDPSYPAFRVPFMELGEDCHRPFWALDALAEEEPEPVAGSGGSGGTGGAGGMGGSGGSGGTGGSGTPCVTNSGDCSSGRCCAGLECTPDTAGNVFTCEVPLL